MLDATAVTSKDSLGILATAIVVGLGHVVTEWRNKRKASSGQSTLARIEKKIDDYQLETRATYQALSARVDEIQTDATDALHHAVGVDGKNGQRSRIEALEAWQENETIRERERLQQLERDRELELRLGPDRRAPKPTDVGSLTPRAV